MIVIDEKTIFDVISQKKPVTVALNAPDGMLPQVQQTAINITKKFDIPAFVLADTTWGTCDLNSNGAKVLGADILFNIGHTNKLETFPGEQDNVIMIDAFDNISFDNVIPKAIEILKGKKVSLITDSQHLHQIEPVRRELEKGGIVIKVGKGKGQLNDGQVFGCEFYPAMEIKEEVDANLFLGQSNFHAAGVALSTKVRTYILDPYFNEVRDVTDFSNKLEKRATLKIFKATEAKVFGVIVGLKEGQFAKITALKFKKELEERGKEVQLLALTDITNDRLKNFTGIDAFIQVACPRISTDNEFDKPLLSTPQANALLKMLKNEKLDNYLEIPHWL
ncbi:MAG: diphthamide biosynthesis enzyme Dph2 [Candidatus Nitrosopelagicus sp.]|nr:diphthamide biosynthesis enzyme Dph2 [Candidatus Nitrosopelagicus sp.]